MEKIINLESTFTPYTLDMYSTFTFESDEEGILCDLEKEYDDLEWMYDNKEYLQALSNNRLDLLKKNIIDNVILDIQKDGEPTSPRYYNFDTDKSFNNWVIDTDKLDEYINNNLSDYNENKLKDRDGFWWFGDEEQTKLNYYLMTESVKTYPAENYYYDQVDEVPAGEYITYEIIN